MTALDLRLGCIGAGLLCPTFVAAAHYAQPTKHWLTEPFRDYFRQQLFDIRLDRWLVFAELGGLCRSFDGVGRRR